MARLNVPLSPTMAGRDFIYHTDMIQKDIAEEEKARKAREAMARSGTKTF